MFAHSPFDGWESHVNRADRRIDHLKLRFNRSSDESISLRELINEDWCNAGRKSAPVFPELAGRRIDFRQAEFRGHFELSRCRLGEPGAPDSTAARHLSIASTLNRQSLPTRNAGS